MPIVGTTNGTWSKIYDIMWKKFDRMIPPISDYRDYNSEKHGGHQIKG